MNPRRHGAGAATLPGARGPTAARRWLILVFALAPAAAWADPAVRLGARGGVELADGADPSAGVDLRLSFSRTPLTINATFDDVFDANKSLYEVSVNAIYYLPLSLPRVDPYAGIGASVTVFALHQETPDADGNGNRLGMNLIAGTCFDLPFVAPFIQVVKQIGEFHPLAFSGGFVVALDRDDRWTGCGRRAR